MYCNIDGNIDGLHGVFTEGCPGGTLSRTSLQDEESLGGRDMDRDGGSNRNGDCRLHSDSEEIEEGWTVMRGRRRDREGQ